MNARPTQRGIGNFNGVILQEITKIRSTFREVSRTDFHAIFCYDVERVEGLFVLDKVSFIRNLKTETKEKDIQGKLTVFPNNGDTRTETIQAVLVLKVGEVGLFIKIRAKPTKDVNVSVRQEKGVRNSNKVQISIL